MKRFPNKEWSGPAWYGCKTDEDGFPEEFTLEDFHPLDLGGHSSTEWDAEDLAKILKTKLKNKALKKCFMGLIHSHHTMGAFFSGTDTSTIEEMAPVKGFYPSLIAASSGKAQYAFGFSYKDQYGRVSCFEIDEDDIKLPRARGKKEWVDIAKEIESNKTTAVVKTTTYNGYNGYTGWGGYNHYPGQSNLFGGIDEPFVIDNSERKKIYNKIDIKGLNAKSSKKAFDLYENYCNGKVNFTNLEAKLEEIGIKDIWLFMREVRDASTDAAIECGF